MKEDLKMAKKELNELKEQSFALELLRDYKKANKRQFIIILVILGMWLLTIGAFLYYINTTGYEETIEYANTDDNGNACVGDNCYNGDIIYGNSD